MPVLLVSAADTPEPAPVGGEGDVWAEVIADEADPALRRLFVQRREFGIAKYGQPLRRQDGRDHEVDLIQELLDGVAYARSCRNGLVENILRAVLRDLTA